MSGDYCGCDDPAEVYCAARHKARKVHRCDECSAQIQSGETYERTFMIFEGEAVVYRTCAPCLALRDFVTAHVPCFCVCHGNMIEDAVGAADYYGHEAPGLYFGALRRQLLIEKRRESQSRSAAR